MENQNEKSPLTRSITNGRLSMPEGEKDSAARESREQSPEPAHQWREERKIRFEHWLQYGSDRLDDAWVSICPHAHSQEIEPMLLSEVVQAIRTGGPIAVTTRWDRKNIYLDDNQAKVRELYQLGQEEADMLNRSRIERLLVEKGLKAESRVDRRTTKQPKSNVDFFYYRSLWVDGVRRNIPKGIVYHCPDATGEARADDAKKWTPGVTLAGLCLGLRNMKYVVRYTGLFPINVGEMDWYGDPEDAIKHPSVRLVFTSITGTGLCICASGPVARDPDEYKKLYKKISTELCHDLDVESKANEASFDPARLTFLPYDEDVFFQA